MAAEGDRRLCAKILPSGTVDSTTTSARWQPPWMVCLTVLSVELGRNGKWRWLDKGGIELLPALTL